MLGEAGVLMDSVLPTHRPVAPEVRMGDCSREVTVIKRPKRIPLAFVDPDVHAESCVADKLCRDVLFKSSTSWTSALACQDVEKLWSLWCADAESYLCMRAKLAGLSIDERRCLGRGRVCFVKRHVGMPCDSNGCGRSAKTSKLGKLKRRLADLLRQVLARAGLGVTGIVGGSSYVMQCLWDKCRKFGSILVPDIECVQIWQNVNIPCAADLQFLLGCVTRAIQSQQLAERCERERIWRQKLATDWQDGGAQTYRWCKGEESERANMITRPDGSLTCDADEMDELVRNAWLPVFQMYKHCAKPSWACFCEQFGKYFAPRFEMKVDDVTGELLHKTLARMRSKSAPGCDGWHVDEFKRLPQVLLDRVACLLNMVEETGMWPDALCQGIVSLITKGEGTDPLKSRPIGVMSVVYRLWAATRVRQVLEWQEHWIDESLHGFRKAHGAEDVWLAQALRVEEALLHSESLSACPLIMVSALTESRLISSCSLLRNRVCPCVL